MENETWRVLVEACWTLEQSGSFRMQSSHYRCARFLAIFLTVFDCVSCSLLQSLWQTAH